MKGKYKKFEKGLYNEFDEPAKRAVAAHLTFIGHTVTVPPENFGPDLYSYWGPRKCYHEVEVSRGWKKHNFPFFHSSVPERKKKLLSKVGNSELFFWMLRLDYKRAIITPHVCLVDDTWLVEVPNKQIATGEYFYRPPLKFIKETNLCQ